MNVARIRDGVVVNIEVADSEDYLHDTLRSGDTLVEYSDDAPAFIGYGYDPDKGFEQPPEDGEPSEWRR